MSIMDEPLMSDAPAERDSTEIEALAELVHSEGWILYLQHIDHEWGPVAYARKIDAAILEGKQTRLSGEEIAETVAEIAIAARKVHEMTRWPGTRLAQLKAEARKKPGMFAGLRRA